jgi:hypothetical protein
MEHNAAGRFQFGGAFRFHTSWFFAPRGSRRTLSAPARIVVNVFAMRLASVVVFIFISVFLFG